MNPRTVDKGSREYKNLAAVAAMLEATSPNNARYAVEDVYFDYGQDWVWTTICRRGWRECQMLCPRDWSNIVLAESAHDLYLCVREIQSDKYFSDVKEEKAV